MNLSSRQRRLILESDERLRMLERQVSEGDYGMWKDYLQAAYRKGKFSRDKGGIRHAPIENFIEALMLVPLDMLMESSESLLDWLRGLFSNILNDSGNSDDSHHLGYNDECLQCRGCEPTCKNVEKFFQRLEEGNNLFAADLVGLVGQALNKAEGTTEGNVERTVNFIIGHIVGD